MDYILYMDIHPSTSHTVSPNRQSPVAPDGRNVFTFSEDNILDYTVARMFHEHIGPDHNISLVTRAHKRRFNLSHFNESDDFLLQINTAWSSDETDFNSWEVSRSPSQ